MTTPKLHIDFGCKSGIMRLNSATIPFYVMRLGDTHVTVTDGALIAIKNKHDAYVWSMYATQPAYRNYEACDYQELMYRFGSLIGQAGLYITEILWKDAPDGK